MTDLQLRASKKIGLYERFLIASILLYGGLVFCLPVPHTEEVATLYPWWAKRISVGNVLLSELLFLGWAITYGRSYITRSILNKGVPARQAALWLMALAIWCGLASVTAPFALQDLGRTFRLLLLAMLSLSVVRWTWQSKNFPLEMLMLGFLIGTIINLIISYRFPLVVLGTMRLSGQNTPGVAMGIAIHLSAWLFFNSEKYLVRLFSLIAALILGFGCAISFSRIGWFAGALGLFAWAYVMVIAKPLNPSNRRSLKKMRRVLVPVVVFALVMAPSSRYVRDGLEWIQMLFQQKISSKQESDDIRWAYFNGTVEIVSKYPLGVGYSGFFDAMTDTDTYYSGSAAEEDSPADANPHATFLWYATAGGIPGGGMAIVITLMLFNSMRFGLRNAMRRPGTVLFSLVTLPYLVIGMTVPYLLNSMILIVPAAIAAGWGWRTGAMSLTTVRINR